MSEAWPRAARPAPEVVQRRSVVAEAAANGDATPARDHLADSDDRVRETALRSLHRLGELDQHQLDQAAADDSARVRRGLADVGATDRRVRVADLITDPDESVCEVACWAAGERGSADAALIELLATVATKHAEPLCRESAVAALGAIGSPLGLPAILAATSDKATVRRRAVLALAPFDSPEVTEALERALEDRDWQVRQAAEDLL